MKAPAMFTIAFLVAALVLFLLAAAGVPSARVNLIAAGLACWVASALVSAF